MFVCLFFNYFQESSSQIWWTCIVYEAICIYVLCKDQKLTELPLSERSCACHEYYDNCSICRALGSNHYSKQHSLISALREEFVCFLIAKHLPPSQQPRMFHNNSQVFFTFITCKKGRFSNSSQRLIFKKICLAVSIILDWELLACCDQKAPLTKSIKSNESTTF